MIDIEAIKARLAAAMPGPWMELAESGEWWIGRNCEDPEQFGAWITASGDMSDENIDLVIHAPTDLADLVAEVERLRTALNTVGSTIYTQGRGTKGEQRLLAFIRETLSHQSS